MKHSKWREALLNVLFYSGALILAYVFGKFWHWVYWSVL